MARHGFAVGVAGWTIVVASACGSQAPATQPAPPDQEQAAAFECKGDELWTTRDGKNVKLGGATYLSDDRGVTGFVDCVVGAPSVTRYRVVDAGVADGKLELSCADGHKRYSLSTGTGAGGCSRSRDPAGNVVAALCTDTQGNAAEAGCVWNGGEGGCNRATGAGACLIAH